MNAANLSRVTEVAERVGQSEGIEIVEVELKGGGSRRVLRIFIDKPDGVTLNDCETISHQVSTILDVEDLIPGSYTLEVSSPGVERKLKKQKDFERFAGSRIKVVLHEPVENQRHLSGILVGIDGGLITLEPSPGKSVTFSLDQVEKANLIFEW